MTTDLQTHLDALKAAGEAPEWFTTAGLATISDGYMLPGETPRSMYTRVAQAAASHFADSVLWSQRYFDLMWKGWLAPASPVLSNMGTDRALPVSCNSLSIADSVHGIFTKVTELAMLTKNGAGVGGYFGRVRARGTAIKGNGQSEGVIPWLKVYDSSIIATSQGSVRRGSFAAYLPIEHGDAEEFLQIRKPVGDKNRQCVNIHHAFTITDAWMESLIAGDAKKRHMWGELLATRFSSGEPYMLFIDTINQANPEAYKRNNLRVETSNLCSEITLHTDPYHTFVCCLSSLNLAKYDEWKDTDTVQVAVRFLDGVLEEYIQKATGQLGLEPAVRSAVKGRALGLGVLGWHSLLQQRMLPFDSYGAMMLNAEVFRTLRLKADEETQRLAVERGEPLWCAGSGRRNTHCLAVAPTTSNSEICGGQSAGIEPWAANLFVKKSARGTFFNKNQQLAALLESRRQNTTETWTQILENSGSVQTLDCLSDEEKAVFLTAREVNQHAIVKQAGQRQRWIDQGQSVNLFFAKNADPKYIHEVHLAAWQEKLKGLYYLRSEGVLKGDLASRSKDECAACEG